MTRVPGYYGNRYGQLSVVAKQCPDYVEPCSLQWMRRKEKVRSRDRALFGADDEEGREEVDMADVAALFVEKGGVYCNRDDCDPWDITRDARKYAGPLPVVAHPPCERWGRYWSGGPSARVRRLLGDDQQCFAAAIWSVRTFGGVLEHPEASHAFKFYGVAKPPKRGGWIPAGDGRGHVCCVEQGHYGHRARKATWLYAVGCVLPELTWGKCHGKDRLDDGFHSTEERRRATRTGICQRLSRLQRLATPPEFAELLISIAKTARSK